MLANRRRIWWSKTIQEEAEAEAEAEAKKEKEEEDGRLKSDSQVPGEGHTEESDGIEV